MEYIYAVMLLNSAKKELSEANMTAVIKAAGIDVDTSKIKSVIASLDGLDIEKVIEENAMAPTAVASTTDSTSPEETKKEKKVEDKISVEDSAAGLGSLF